MLQSLDVTEPLSPARVEAIHMRQKSRVEIIVPKYRVFLN